MGVFPSNNVSTNRRRRHGCRRLARQRLRRPVSDTAPSGGERAYSEEYPGSLTPVLERVTGVVFNTPWWLQRHWWGTRKALVGMAEPGTATVNVSLAAHIAPATVAEVAVIAMIGNAASVAAYVAATVAALTEAPHGAAVATTTGGDETLGSGSGPTSPDGRPRG